LVGLGDSQTAQQIRVYFVPWFRLGRARTPVQDLYPHALHEHLHMPAADLAPTAIAACRGGNKPIECQQAAQHPRTGERELGVQPVDLRHKVQIGR